MYTSLEGDKESNIDLGVFCLFCLLLVRCYYYYYYYHYYYYYYYYYYYLFGKALL
jgi:hypothetical protein